MKIPAAIRSLLAAALVVAASSPCHADEKTDQAVKAAGSWLALVDAMEYKESWAVAAPFFKERVAENDWVRMISLARGPLGGLQSRKLKSAQYTTSLPGAPDGEYVVIQYESAFQSKAHAVETITPMKDGGGAWRVSGYYIK